MALEGISELSDEQGGVLFTKLYHLNAYQKDVLERLEVTNPDDKKVIKEAIDLCRQRGEWMKQCQMRPTSEMKENLQRDENSPWRRWCRWQK